MPLKARKGDAISHGGQIVEGSPNVATNGIPAARKGDAVMCAVHGLQRIAGGSGTVLVNGRPQARIGDPITCGAVITGSSPDVSAGG